MNPKLESFLIDRLESIRNHWTPQPIIPDPKTVTDRTRDRTLGILTLRVECTSINILGPFRSRVEDRTQRNYQVSYVIFFSEEDKVFMIICLIGEVY